jgi:hypothetical protein
VSDPHEPIINRLTRPREEPRSVERSDRGWTATVGGHVPVRPDSIRFVRERFVDDHGLVVVEYEDEDGRAWFMVFGVTRTHAGTWQVTSSAGGSGSQPPITLPWANLGAWWDDRVACAGGHVHGSQVRTVRLVAADGQTAEDHIDESGIALVLAVGPFARPWTVELYDAAGGLVRSHPFNQGRTG